MKRIISCIIILLLTQPFADAQNHLFKVFYVTGEVSISQKSQSGNLTKDQLIYSGDKIKISEKSTLVLLNTENKPLVIEKDGSYSTKNISNLYADINNENISQKYFNYVVEEFMHHQAEKKYTGAVSRGKGLSMRRPFDSCIIMSNQIIFQWNNPEQIDYWFFIYTIDGKRIFESQGKDSEIIIYTDKTELKKGNAYLWMVSVNQFPAKDDLLNIFSLASEDQVHLFTNEMNAIKERFISEEYGWDMGTNLLLLYGFFITNKLYEEAEKTKKIIQDNYPNAHLFND